MKKILFSIFFLLIGCSVWAEQALPVAPFLPATSSEKDWSAPITVQYPTEKMTLPYGAQKIYLFGNIHLPEPKLEINGQEVPVHTNGGFIATIPVEQGTFDITLTATSQDQTYQAVRHVTVPGIALKNFTKKARLDEPRLYPRKPLWVLPGETITLSASGTPEAKVTASLNGLAKQIALKESASTPGFYQAFYQIPTNAEPRSVKVTYQLNDPKTHSKTKATAKQRIKILDPKKPLQPIRINDPGVKLRSQPVHQGSLYPYYRAYGEALIDGRDNGLYRLNLADGQQIWLEGKKIDFISESSYKPNHIEDLRTVSDSDKTLIQWNASKQVPVLIHEFSDRIEVVFYYTENFEENFDFDATSPLLDHIQWEDPKDGVIKFTILFKPEQMLWGHSYRYEENTFVLSLNHKPALSPTAKKPLLGARILLDAGHSPKRKPPYDGLVSPSGFLEYEANLALAEVIKPKLEAAGATVIMTREGDNHMSLPDRYEKALKDQAHVFISLHHNALPDTADPFAKPLGYSVYYMYPHSFKLGEAVHRAFNKNIQLPDSGLVANDILFIPRIPDMPSILIENAYMILPEQEEMVMSPKGRELFAQTVYEGILDFYQQMYPTEEQTKK